MLLRKEEFMKFDIKPEEEISLEEQAKKKNLQEEETDICEIPSKCVRYEETIFVAAKIVQIDFEGRSDGESLKQIVLALKPRRLLVIRGTPASAKIIVNFTKVFCDTAVFSPKVGQCLNVTSESHIYQVKYLNLILIRIKPFRN